MSQTVFWSWQSDLSPSLTKDFIKGALVEALDTVAQELDLESADRLEIDHDTKGEAGLVEIVTTIFNKIDDCQVFVADITPVAEIKTETSTKKVPNPNVMIELGYALREVGYRRVITVANLAFGGKPEELPFDLRHRRGAITYTLADIKDPSKDKVRKGLVKELVSALKTNLAAPREEQIIRNPLPLLSIERGDEMPNILSIRQDVRLDDVPALAEIMAETPVKTKADQNVPPSPFEDIQLGPLNIYSRRPKPFRQWTEEELDGYNQTVQRYYKRYENYLEELKEYKLLRQRAIVMHLDIENDGTKPATDVRGTITFPAGFLIYENDELPHPPVKPAPPKFAPPGSTSVMGEVVSHYPRILPDPRISDNHKTLVFRSKKIPQGHMASIASFTVVMKSEEDIGSFQIRYRVGADELPRQATGELHFEVELADS